MELDVRHLRAICAIAEAGSVSRAAVRLGISQPSLTALLQRVERTLGGELFVRSRTGVTPTPLGHRALQRARLVVAEIDGFTGELLQADPSTTRTLRLGSVHMECCGSVLDNVVAALPDAEITMQVEPSAVALSQSLSHDRLDLAVIGMMDDHEVGLGTDLAQRMLVPKVPIFVAIGARHRLADRDEIDLADLAEDAWISPPGADDGSLTSLRSACRRAGFVPRIRFEAPTGGGAQLIETGRAIQLVEPTSVSRGGLVVRRLVGEPLRARLLLAWRRSRVSEVDAEQVYLAVARAYVEHAVDNPTYGPWWAAHPEVHPRTD
ncbi:LysR family transcriptional regulator [Longispora sp. NPDC051575]|uniref:LysR family transcriptional regulator n=1 Tax=Longispora sp. NPDC051575 TaxID=3154943 RepID=UPI003431EB25